MKATSTLVITRGRKVIEREFEKDYQSIQYLNSGGHMLPKTGLSIYLISRYPHTGEHLYLVKLDKNQYMADYMGLLKNFQFTETGKYIPLKQDRSFTWKIT